MMKKLLWASFILMAGWHIASAEEPLLPPGAGGNMLLNGKLELIAGDFPDPWSNRNHRPDYRPNGSPRGGGTFRFHAPGKLHIVRQDWTFSIVEGETYRLSAWVRSSDFTAKRSEIVVFNNGWSAGSTLEIPEGTADWHKLELIFKGFPSKGGVGSVAIVVDKIGSGELEITDLVVEPATAGAKKAALAYLDEIPPQTLVPLTPRLERIQRTLRLRWFGAKTVNNVVWRVDGGAERQSKIGADGIVELDCSGLSEGAHELNVTADNFSAGWPIVKIAEVKAPATRRKNNLHEQLAVIDGKAGGESEFVTPRDGWVNFQIPPGMTIEIAGSKRPLSAAGGLVRLQAGTHRFRMRGGDGPIVIAAIAETFYYQLAGGPYLPGIPRNTYEMVKKHQLDCVTTFNNGSPGCEANWHDFRDLHNNRLLAHGTVAEALKPQPKLAGVNPDQWRFDGVTLDEFSANNDRQFAAAIKNRRQLAAAPGKSIDCWLTGAPGNSAITAGFMSMIYNDLRGRLLFESYVPSNTVDPAAAAALIARRTSGVFRQFEQLYPGCRNFYGVILTPGNIPLTYTVDNEPEADYKYFLDMQMHHLATAPEFAGLGLVGFWGGNYADAEITRWAAALLRHYVIRGETGMLSEQYGYKLAPGHLKNCSFRAGLQHWRTSGEVTTGKYDNVAAIIRRFAVEPGDGDHYAIVPPGGAIAQTAQGLTPGQLYLLKFVTSDAYDIANGAAGKRPLTATVNHAEERTDLRYQFRKPEKPLGTPQFGRANYDAMVFRATAPEAEITLRAAPDAGGATALHYVSLMPYFEENR